MPRARDELTAGEWAVLALLAEGPTHGFAMARAMEPEGEVGRIWSGASDGTRSLATPRRQGAPSGTRYSTVSNPCASNRSRTHSAGSA